MRRLGPISTFRPNSLLLADKWEQGVGKREFHALS